MAHKTLIGGTAYGIIGGKTTVDGTSYGIVNGKVRIDGTIYNIPFSNSGEKDVWGGTYTAEIKCITYTNGFWVVGGKYYDGATSYARIAYTTDPNGTWTIKNLWSDSKNASCVECITYANGYWIAGGTWYGSDGGYSYYWGRVAHGANLSDTWTKTNLQGGSQSNSGVYCIAYGNGYWVVGGTANGNVGNIFYTSSLSGKWTGKDLWKSDAVTNNNYVKCITYTNGYWVVGGCYYDGNQNYPYVGYSTSLADSWRFQSPWTPTSGSYPKNMVTDITYANGYWVVCGEHPYVGYNYARIAYTTSLGSSWTTKDIFNQGGLRGIAYANGYWIVCGQHLDNNDGQYCAFVAHSTSLTGTWTIQDLWRGSKVNILNDVAFADDFLMTGGLFYDNTNYKGRISYTNNGVTFATS